MTTALNCITELGKNALGIVAVTLMLKDIFGYRLNVRKAAVIITGILFTAASVLPHILIQDSTSAADITDFVSLGAFILFPYLLFKSKKKLTFLLFGIIMNATADFAVLIITTTFGITSHTVTALLFCAIYAVCILVICIAKAKQKVIPPRNFFENIPTIVYVVILLADLSTYYTVTLATNTEYIKDISNFLMILSAVLVVACIAFIIFRYYLLSDKHKETEMMLNAQLEHNEQIMKHNADIRRFRHDYTNNIFALNLLLEQNRTDEAKEFIAKMNDLPALTQTRYATGNYLADAIITAKATDAAKKSITIDFSGTIPYAKISNNDICTILSNVLDNAITACPEGTSVPISITSAEQNGGVLITVSNPVAGKVEIVNNSVKTSKKDKANHGFGITNIKSVAKKHNGFVNLSCNSGLFTIEIGLMFKGDN